MTDSLFEKHVRVNEMVKGPYTIYVENTIDLDPKDWDYQAVAPEGGWPDVAAALAYIEDNYANRKEPYLGLKFHVVPMRTPGSFNQYCSWED